MSLTDVFGYPLLSKGALRGVFGFTGRRKVAVATSVVVPELKRALSSVTKTLRCMSCFFPGCSRTYLVANRGRRSGITSGLCSCKIGGIIVGVNGHNYCVHGGRNIVVMPTYGKVATVSAVKTKSGFTSKFVTTLLRKGGLGRYKRCTGYATTVTIRRPKTASKIRGHRVMRRVLTGCGGSCR